MTRSCRLCGTPFTIVRGIWQCPKCAEKQKPYRKYYSSMIRLINDERVPAKTKLKEFEKLNDVMDKLQRLENDS